MARSANPITFTCNNQFSGHSALGLNLSALLLMNPYNVIPDFTDPVRVPLGDHLSEPFQCRVVVIAGKASGIIDKDDVPSHRVVQNAIKFPPDRGVLLASPCEPSRVVPI